MTMAELILVSSQSGSLPGSSGISVSVFAARRRSAGVSPAALLPRRSPQSLAVTTERPTAASGRHLILALRENLHLTFLPLSAMVDDN